jgi:hypothetical protein
MLFIALLYQTRQDLSLMIRSTFIFMIGAAIVFVLIGESTRTLITFRVESKLIGTADITTMTTGRSELQAEYLEYFRKNIGALLLGRGLAAPNIGSGGLGPHNTFIDLAYFFGIAGGLIYIGTLFGFIRVKLRQTKTRLYHWFPVAGLAIRLMAISLLLLHNMTFYYLLIWLSLTRGAEAAEHEAPALQAKL